VAVGLFIKARYPDIAESWGPSVNQTSGISLKLVVVLMVVSQLQAVIGLIGSLALLVAVLIVIASLAMGYVLGGPGQATRRVTATTSTVRNNAVALVLAAPLDPLVSVVALAYALIAVIGGSVAAGEWAKRDKAKAGGEAEAAEAAA
jgi:BASS family bile acid:Na+ symporter